MPAPRMVLCVSHSPLMDGADGGPAGTRFSAALDAAALKVARFDPELVVFFGPDHVRAFVDVVPSIAVVRSAVGYGDWGTPDGDYDVDRDTADKVAVALLEAGFDVTVGDGVRLDHGFGQSWMQLLGELDVVPIVPIVLNCARPPLAPLSRALGVGRRVGAHLAQDPRRIMFLGSGGLSHSPPALETDTSHLSEDERRQFNLDRVKAAGERVDPEWDDRVLTALCDGELDQLASMSAEEVAAAGVGANELRTWIAACAASPVLPRRVAYEPVPQWITGMGLIASPA